MTVGDLTDFEIVQTVQAAIAAERALLQPHVRTSRERVEALLDGDFTEIGASGRLWSRPEMIEALLAENADAAPATDQEMNANLLTPDLVLLTYVSERAGRNARRSSVWRRAGDGHWQLLFHQGTPVD